METEAALLLVSAHSFSIGKAVWRFRSLAIRVNLGPVFLILERSGGSPFPKI